MKTVIFVIFICVVALDFYKLNYLKSKARKQIKSTKDDKSGLTLCYIAIIAEYVGRIYMLALVAAMCAVAYNFGIFN